MRPYAAALGLGIALLLGRDVYAQSALRQEGEKLLAEFAPVARRSSQILTAKSILLDMQADCAKEYDKHKDPLEGTKAVGACQDEIEPILGGIDKLTGKYAPDMVALNQKLRDYFSRMNQEPETAKAIRGQYATIVSPVQTAADAAQKSSARVEASLTELLTRQRNAQTEAEEKLKEQLKQRKY